MPRLRAEDCVLIVVDVQERLAPAVSGHETVVANTRILQQAAGRLDVPVLVSEQYPRGLGPTIGSVASLVTPDQVIEKIEFSAAANATFAARLADLGPRTAVVCGMEAHVCVLQTAMDLAATGASVSLVRDACGSRDPANADTAFARAARDGIAIVTTEMVVFEWLYQAGSPEFRELSRLIK